MSVPTVVSSLPPGTAVSRLIMALGRSGGDALSAAAVAERWKDSPQVAATLGTWITKAAVPAGTTRDATWASPLAPYGIAREAVTIMRGQSILGALEPRMVKVPPHVSVPVETGTGILGGWVAEGAAAPVNKTAFTALVEELYKFMVIVPLSRELVRFSTPDAEQTIRTAVLGGLSARLDEQLLLPSVAAVPATNPASITNGAIEITSTGSTSAQISADLGAMVAAMTTAGGGLTWVMRPTTAARIAGALGSAAADLPRTLYALPVMTSKNSPAQITLIDANAIVYSDSGQFDLDVSGQATLQLADNPDPTPTAASVQTSLWQTNTIAIRAMRWLAWRRAVDGSVVFMTVAY